MIHSSPSSPMPSTETSWWEGLFLESRSPPSAEADNLLDGYATVNDDDAEDDRTMFRHVDQHMFSQTIPEALGFGGISCSAQEYHPRGPLQPSWFSPPRRDAFSVGVTEAREAEGLHCNESERGECPFEEEYSCALQKNHQRRNESMIPMDLGNRESLSLNNSRIDFMHSDDELSCSSEQSFLPMSRKTQILLEELLPSSSMEKNMENREDRPIGLTTTTKNHDLTNEREVFRNRKKHENNNVISSLQDTTPPLAAIEPVCMMSNPAAQTAIFPRSSSNSGGVTWNNNLAPKKKTAFPPQSLVHQMMAGFAFLPSIKMTAEEEHCLLSMHSSQTRRAMHGIMIQQLSSEAMNNRTHVPHSGCQGNLTSMEDFPACVSRPGHYEPAVTRSSAIINTPLEFDILLGRGHGVNRHPGNTRFRSFIVQYRELYRASTVCEKKTAITQLLVGMCKAPFCHKGFWVIPRFLRFQKELDGWEEVSDEVARQKISHLLRLRENHNATAIASRNRRGKGR